MERYYIDFLAWMWRALPRPLQRSRNIQMLWGLAASLRDLHGQLMPWAAATLYALKWTGQTGILERFLQLEMGTDGIWLENLKRNTSGAYVGIEPQTLSQVSDQDTPSTWIRAGSGTAGATAIVHVPRYLEGDEPRLRALIAKYKVEQVIYIIEYYD